jgi:hypothetical protein
MKNRKACVLDIDMELLVVMLSNVQWKYYGCHLYGMKRRKACVLDIDMELHAVMLNNVQWKYYGCHLYGMKNRKACLLHIDMELHAVMSCKVLCRYVDTICGADIYFVFSLDIFVINVISSLWFPYICCISHEYSCGFLFNYVSGLCNAVQWANGMSTAKCCDNKKVQQVFH